MTEKPANEKPRSDRLVGVEARKLYATKLEDGFIAKYLSGRAVLDIGYRGYEPEVVPIVPQAVGVELDYPGYDGRTLPFPDNSQDAVFSSHCLEHVEDCRAAIREWFRVLKIDGYLVLAVPHKLLYERRERPPSRWNIDHRRFFTPATLLLRVEEALASNSYRVRHLVDNDFAYGYLIPPESHPGGCYEIELVIQKIALPPWELERPPLTERKALLKPLLEPPTSRTDEADGSAVAKGRIIYDGLNLALSKGTGITTYTRILAETSRNLGYEVGVVYETPFSIPKSPPLQDLLFFDHAAGEKRLPREKSISQSLGRDLLERLQRRLTIRPIPLRLEGTVDARQFVDRLPVRHQAFVAKNLFKMAKRYFNDTGRLINVSFEETPDIFHCTYALPLKVKNSCNVCTIHDLVQLRLPRATTDDKREIYNLLKAVAAKADHIVTVSESSKRDIIDLLGVAENRVTNTYQTVIFPDEYLERPEEMVANYLSGLYGLEMRRYLLFVGAVEPKKNVGRLIEAYLSAGVEIPLVLVTGTGWLNDGELLRLREHSSAARANDTEPAIRQLDHLDRSDLVNLIRGARAVLFPSLLEGFGLPVLEAMTLGTAVLTSSNGALAEIAGDAALLVDPYDVGDIARGITALANDIDLCGELSQRGLVQADKFSLEKYQERIASLYASLR